MTITIRCATHITEAEQQHLFGWGEDIYNDNCYQLQWRPRHWRFFVSAEGGELVSHVGIVAHEIAIDTTPMTVGGIGQVVTVPAAQGRGYAQAGLKAAATFLHDELQVAFGVLFCIERMLPFYTRLGWQQISNTVLINQPAGQIRSPMPVMVLPCRERVWPAGVVDLRSLPW